MNTTQQVTMNGAMVLFRTDTTIFVRIPRDLQQPINGGCACDYCKAQLAKNPSYVATWDTFAVGLEAPRRYTENDYGYTCHMPDPISARLAHQRLAQQRKQRKLAEAA